ncbi:MAG: fabG 20 [Verrucomicrobiaceae bacterium]|nr:fabG 20 [Verrucomicrobiaceae bacterium]
MNLGLQGRHALVTGGSKGIGVGIVRALAAEGVSVTFCGRNTEDGARTERELKAENLNVRFIVGDVENNAGIDALAASASAIQPVEILVNNVGNPSNTDGVLRKWLEVPTIDWEKTFYKNVISAQRLCDLLVPAMCNRHWGRVINISSSAGIQPGDEVPPDYSVAKAALNAMTMTLARALASTGVTVNTVTPGPILTEGQRGWIILLASERGWPGEFADWERRFIKEDMHLTVDRLGCPKDIGRAVAFLAAADADFITGANFRIDGGQTRSAI